MRLVERRSKENNMNTLFDRLLAQTKYQEMLDEAAEARAEKKSHKPLLALTTVSSLAFLLGWVFVK